MSLLDAFVEQCLLERVVIIAAVGEGCSHIEDLIDQIVVGDGSDPTRFVMTTAHSGEALEQVLEFLRSYPVEGGQNIEIVSL